MAAAIARSSLTTGRAVSVLLSESLHQKDSVSLSHMPSLGAGKASSKVALKSGFLGALEKPFRSPAAQFTIWQRQARRQLVVRAQEVPLTAAPPVAYGAATVGLTTPTKPIVPEIAFAASEKSPVEFQGDVLVFGVFEEALDKETSFAFVGQDLKEVDEALGGLLAELAQEEEFKGKVGQSVFARVPGKGFKRVGLVGLGGIKSASTPGAWKALGGALAGAAKQARAAAAGVAILGAAELEPAAKVAAAGAIASGTVLGVFEDARFKSEAKPPTLQTVALFGLGAGPELDEGVAVAVRVASGVMLTKQLVNAPPNVLTPVAMAEVAEAIAMAHSDVMTATILDEEECARLGMGAYLGVAVASDNAPRFIHLQYTPSGTVHKKLAIIGKGLTFDSGGYNIKAGAGSMIELMKFDMGGAGATLGAAKAIGAIQPPGVEVHFIIAACENMISGKGMRPGDILTASNGRTIEVNNTDAEGRLTLADALVYACKLKVDAIVDLATLTGACIIALGTDIAGMFTPHDSMAAELEAASKVAGEKLWRMPMEESYKEMLKSNIADTVNTGGRPGGSITAALFLKEFVDPAIPWAHLDIAGPVWNEKKGGGTGYAVATLVQWVATYAKAEE